MGTVKLLLKPQLNFFHAQFHEIFLKTNNIVSEDKDLSCGIKMNAKSMGFDPIVIKNDFRVRKCQEDTCA
jgi:uncharacterized protein (UPF0335 family)